MLTSTESAVRTPIAPTSSPLPATRLIPVAVMIPDAPISPVTERSPTTLVLALKVDTPATTSSSKSVCPSTSSPPVLTKNFSAVPIPLTLN